MYLQITRVNKIAPFNAEKEMAMAFIYLPYFLRAESGRMVPMAAFTMPITHTKCVDIPIMIMLSVDPNASGSILL